MMLITNMTLWTVFNTSCVVTPKVLSLGCVVAVKCPYPLQAKWLLALDAKHCLGYGHGHAAARATHANMRAYAMHACGMRS